MEHARRLEYHGRVMAADIGECIYCRRKPPEVSLTEEHTIPFAMGTDVYLANASCEDCAALTSRDERHFARNFFGHLRIHGNIQTRRPSKRPSTLPVWVTRAGIEYEKHLAVQDHPFFVKLPIWAAPASLFGRSNLAGFPNLHWTQYHWLPSNLYEVLGLLPGELVKLTVKVKQDVPTFARVIAKIAYASTVGRFGMDAIDWGDLPEVILGRRPNISDYVGNREIQPKPPDGVGPLHKIETLDVTINGRRQIMCDIRLFCANTVDNMNVGMPTYTVALGAPRDDGPLGSLA